MTAILAATGTPAPVAYTGLAMAPASSGTLLYAANNAGTGRIDVFNETFAKASVTGTFTDPTAPPGDAPFNIVNIGTRLPVGVVDIFTRWRFCRPFRHQRQADESLASHWVHVAGGGQLLT